MNQRCCVNNIDYLGNEGVPKEVRETSSCGYCFLVAPCAPIDFWVTGNEFCMDKSGDCLCLASQCRVFNTKELCAQR